MPMLTPTLKIRSFQMKRYSAMARRMSSAIWRAFSSGQPTSRTPNSSPPRRATVSESRTASRMSEALAQHVVAREVTARVVHHLEAVEVQVAHHVALAAGARDFERLAERLSNSRRLTRPVRASWLAW
jgi:hypothetical protein